MDDEELNVETYTKEVIPGGAVWIDQSQMQVIQSLTSQWKSTEA